MLIVHSFSQGQGLSEQDARAWLRDSGSVSVPELYAEYADALRFADPASRALFRDYLARRYAERPPDVIVAAYAPALGFLAGDGASLFPGVPRLAVGVNVGELPGGAARAPGVYTPSTIAQSLAFARRLHPGLRRAVLVAGASPVDTLYVAALAGMLRTTSPDVATVRLAGLPLAEVERRLATLGAGDVVFFVTWLGDGDGTPVRPEEIAARLGAIAPVPVHVFVDDYLRPGVVGGVFVPAREIGAATGRLIDAALRRDLGALDALVLPARPVVEWDALRRWSIPASRLPADVVVRNRPPGLWTAYRTQVLAALGVVALQGLLLVALVVARRRERRAEAAEREARLQLAHLGRVATLGELTASLAHELRQPLTAVRLNATAILEWLKRTPHAPEAVAEIVRDVDRHAERADGVIERLRSLFRNDGWNPRPLRLNAVVEAVTSLLERDVAARRAQCQLALDPADPRVAGDEVQLQQVLMNLVLNALDAMAATDGARTVTVRTGATATAVVLEVDDTGPGVPSARRERIFDPFVTSKRDGMGIGLSLVRSIVRAHGGTIAVGDRPGGGARFRVSLPRAADHGAPRRAGQGPGGTGGRAGSTTPRASSS